MFLPVKADFPLPRFPILTVLVCMICAAVFVKQLHDWKDFNAAIERYCELDRSRLENMVFTRRAELKEYGFQVGQPFMVLNFGSHRVMGSV